MSTSGFSRREDTAVRESHSTGLTAPVKPRLHLIYLLAFANKNKIGLIIMGTHGRKGMDRILFGSTAAQIVRFAPCPVLTVRMPKY